MNAKKTLDRKPLDKLYQRVSKLLNEEKTFILIAEHNDPFALKFKNHEFHYEQSSLLSFKYLDRKSKNNILKRKVNVTFSI